MNNATFLITILCAEYKEFKGPLYISFFHKASAEPNDPPEMLWTIFSGASFVAASMIAPMTSPVTASLAFFSVFQ